LNTARIGLAALALLAIVGLSFGEWQRYRHANAEAAEITLSIDAVEQLLSDLTDAETTQRGFLLTGENRYLTPYEQAIQSARDEIARVRDRLKLRLEESSNVAKLTALAPRKIVELQQAIELRRAGHTVPAIALALDQGKKTMDEIRTLCVNIEAAEKGLQRQSSLEGETAAETALVATLVASLGLLLLFAVRLGPGVPRIPNTT
jgi:CHASE3 domain sensor protein